MGKILHLENPAFRWDNTSPVGNGAAGLSVYGTVACEQLLFNEESIWDGGLMDTKIENNVEKLDYIRKLFLEDREEEADEWATKNLGDKSFFRIKAYEYAGMLQVNMIFDDDECTGYSRDIDLTDGVCTVKFEKNGVKYTREYFASYPAGLICGRFTASEKFSCVLSWRRENSTSITTKKDYIIAEAVTANGENPFTVCIKIDTDGRTVVTNAGLAVEDASYLIFYEATLTSFKYDDRLSASAAVMARSNDGWDALLEEHLADHREIMSRSSIDFPTDEKIEAMTVADRLERLKADDSVQDYGLMSLYYEFGKYLLVGSSRPGTLPANLQGVWAEGLTPPWNSDYHTNINLQMNYWQAEEANIGECTQALFDYMNHYLLPGGERVAKENYDARGLVVHHLSDIYTFAAAADGLWGLWPMGGVWLAYHMWDHYLYTKDEEFLRNVAYKFIKDCALFFIDTMFEGPDGYMHTGPSTSPENRYYKEVNGEKKPVYLAISPTMDIEIVGGMFEFYCEAEKILGIDPETADKAAEIRSKMVPLRVGKHGQLMEWLKDYDEPEPGHRHISHAFGLYPGSMLNHSVPELFKAIEVTLDRRLASGGGHTGWSRAWLINLFARLEKGEKAYANVRALFTKSTFPNLYDAHPPFQIDGNFGGAAGIGEMVMQSHEESIALFPAVPAGVDISFRGLRARGGYTVSAELKDGKVENLVIKADEGAAKTVSVRFPCGCVREVECE